MLRFKPKAWSYLSMSFCTSLPLANDRHPLNICWNELAWCWETCGLIAAVGMTDWLAQQEFSPGPSQFQKCTRKKKKMHKKDALNSEKTVTLMVMVYYSEKTQIRMNKRKTHKAKFRRNQGQASSCTLPVSQTAFNSPNNGVWQHMQSVANHGSSPKPWCLEFLLGVSHIGMPHLTLTNSIQPHIGQTDTVWPRVSGTQKQVFIISHIVNMIYLVKLIQCDPRL